MEEGIERQMANILETITKMKEELDRLRPLPPTVLAQVEQKLRLESNYNSNAIEGNTLTLGETRSLILHGLTAHGKPLRDHLDIQGHDSAVKAIEAAVKDYQELNEVFIRNLHRVLLKEPYKAKAETPNGQLIERAISLGDYKTIPNNVRTSTGETYFFTPPEQVKQAMGDLIDWYRAKEREGEHPITIAATFHYRFVRIHPFDDGNGRMARLLMNLILIKHGYTVAMILREERTEYLGKLEQADKTEDLTEFINYVAGCCEYALNLHLKAARGEPIEDIEDIDKEIALFRQSLASSTSETFSAKEYIETVLYPFCEYCDVKVSLLSNVFAEVSGHVSVVGITTEGKTAEFNLDGSDGYFTKTRTRLDSDAIPPHMRSMSAEISIILSNFQARQDPSIWISIENTIDANHCRWKFSIDVPKGEWEHLGRDLDDLKRQFNRLLRNMMDALN